MSGINEDAAEDHPIAVFGICFTPDLRTKCGINAKLLAADHEKGKAVEGQEKADKR